MSKFEAPITVTLADLPTTPFDTALARVEGRIVRCFPQERGSGYSFQNFSIASPDGGTFLLRLSDRKSVGDNVVGQTIRCWSMPKAPRGIIWEQVLAGGTTPQNRGRIVVRKTAAVEFVGSEKVNTRTEPLALATPPARQPELFESDNNVSRHEASNAGEWLSAWDAATGIYSLLVTSGRLKDSVPKDIIIASIAASIVIESKNGGGEAGNIGRIQTPPVPKNTNLIRLTELVRERPETEALIEGFAKFEHLIAPTQTWRDLDDPSAARVLKRLPVAV